jgi:hypothetical protein
MCGDNKNLFFLQGFIQELVLSFPLDKRRTLIRKELRKNLFNLFAGWAGRFGQIFGFNTRPTALGSTSYSSNNNNNNNTTCTEFEFSALQAMLAVLCSGPNFDSTKFAEDGEVYRLLDLLLASEDPNIYNEGQKAVVMLLEAGLEKTRVKKKPAQWVFWFFWFFWFFWVFFGFFLYICPEERVFRGFSVSRILIGASRC